ncbi:AMP-binding protein [Sulfolobus acidocaldarius]|uniref:AMP-dependent synthetase n=1 Tax=Sulfolobus acidocaldarius TaxID=2285 RepID=A0A0U2NH83_9CREN|nr:AMP-dependent synthetase [Sulfolobus acidocaldarius]
MIVRGEKLEELDNPFSIVKALEERSSSDHVAVSYFGRKISYRQLNYMVNSVSSSLDLEKGDVVLLSMQNIPQFIIAEFAIWKRGGIVLPVNPSYTERELDYLIQDSGAKLMIASCESISTDKIPVVRTNPETFGPIPSEYSKAWKLKDCNEELDFKSGGKQANGHETDVRSDDIALLVYTSGTTGKPKGVPITHSNIFASSTIYKHWFKFSERDKNLAIAPFFHITGQIFGITSSILSGSEITTFFRFNPDLTLRVVEEEKTTVTMAVATAYTSMVNAYKGEEDLSSMRLWSSGGMAMPRSLEMKWKEKLGSWIYMAWGLTETTSPATLWPYPYEGDLPLDSEYNVVSSGIPVYNTEVMVSNDGELLVRGPQVVSGDWRMEKFKDGWLPTGDIGKIENGWVYIIDRKKDVINASGFKVMPREVEEVLYMHPAVEEVAVVSVVDEYRGETVGAFIKLREQFSESDELKKDIIDFCRQRLAPYKVPKVVNFVKEIPKTPSGKIMRRAFRNENK